MRRFSRIDLAAEGTQWKEQNQQQFWLLHTGNSLSKHLYVLVIVLVITFKLGNFTHFKTLFPVMSTDFR